MKALRTLPLLSLVTALVVSTATTLHGQPSSADRRGQNQPKDLSSVSLEELMNIEVTSAGRKEQQVKEVPAAVYVITHDDIRRSGLTSVPELLRLVPGVQVAQISASKWAISVRGFNSLYSDKLLVLVDGRSVYNPLFSGVLWDTEDLMLEDVDRIEVIRGPGGAVWGANAVNGVINIITMAASDSPGLLVRAGVGTFDRSDAAIRYGGAAGSNGAYRVYGQFSGHGNSLIAPHLDASDHWMSATSGFRGDWTKGRDAYALQGRGSVSEERPLWVNLNPATQRRDTGAISRTQGGDLLSRWTHARANGDTLQLQSFLDRADREESVGDYTRLTVDVDATYRAALGTRHDLVVGGGYRYIGETVDGGFGYTFTPRRTRTHLVNGFAQDEISLAGNRVQVTLGAKFEHDTYAGSGLQPTSRVMWNVTRTQHLWAATSRALRTPSMVDYGIRLDFPPAMPPAVPGVPASPFPVAISLFGNPDLESERLISTEAGYRREIGSRGVIDVTGFVARYSNLATSEPGAPTLIFVDGRPVLFVKTVFQNLLNADTSGAEFAARFAVTPAWRIDGGFSSFHLTPHPDPASRDPRAAVEDGRAPAWQWRIHSAVDVGPRAQADAQLFYVGALEQLVIPAYTRLDLRFEWKWTPRLSIVGQGQNLLIAAHPEFAGDITTITSTQIPRSASLRLTWRY